MNNSLMRSSFLLIVLMGICTQTVISQTGIIEGGPDPLAGSRSIKQALQEAGNKPTHIIFVHGMGQTDLESSEDFRTTLCAEMPSCSGFAPAHTDFADQGMFADNAPVPAVKYLGNAVWNSAPEWHDSRPFVVHYVMHRNDGGPVIVDEINWWPLAFPLKCLNVISGEAHLAGPNNELIELCAGHRPGHKKVPEGIVFHPWFSEELAEQLEGRSKNGAWLNRKFKNQLMDWGMSDALISVGGYKTILREGMRQLLEKSVSFNPEAPSQAGPDASHNDLWQRGLANDEFIVVSHSLGSYLVFSTVEDTGGQSTGEQASHFVLDHTRLLYFFANQVALLGLADAPICTRTGDACGPDKQIIAFSDSSDMLSWYVPHIDHFKVVNLYVKNGLHWLWMFEGPLAAHTRYAQKGKIIRVMLGDASKVKPEKTLLARSTER